MAGERAEEAEGSGSSPSERSGSSPSERSSAAEAESGDEAKSKAESDDEAARPEATTSERGASRARGEGTSLKKINYEKWGEGNATPLASEAQQPTLAAVMRLLVPAGPPGRHVQSRRHLVIGPGTQKSRNRPWPH